MRDHKGKSIFALHEYYGSGCIVVAELKALVEGLKICLERGYNKILAELDSKVVVDHSLTQVQVHGNFKTWWMKYVEYVPV